MPGSARATHDRSAAASQGARPHAVRAKASDADGRRSLRRSERDRLDLAQRRLELSRLVVRQALLEGGEDLGLGPALDGHDEGEAELRPVGVVEREEAVALLPRQAVEPGRGLLLRRIGRQLRDRRAARRDRDGRGSAPACARGGAASTTAAMRGVQALGVVLRRRRGRRPGASAAIQGECSKTSPRSSATSARLMPLGRRSAGRWWRIQCRATSIRRRHPDALVGGDVVEEARQRRRPARAARRGGSAGRRTSSSGAASPSA